MALVGVFFLPEIDHIISKIMQHNIYLKAIATLVALSLENFLKVESQGNDGYIYGISSHFLV